MLPRVLLPDERHGWFAPPKARPSTTQISKLGAEAPIISSPVSRAEESPARLLDADHPVRGGLDLHALSLDVPQRIEALVHRLLGPRR